MGIGRIARPRYTRAMTDRRPLSHRSAPACHGGRSIFGAALIGLSGLVCLIGCASDRGGPAYLAVPRAEYDAAFDAACAAARESDLPPVTVDRTSGTIDTAARFAGSLAEPWTYGDHTASEIVEGTLAFERRRARFEFVPVGFRAQPPEGSAPLAGPILPGSDRGSGSEVARGSEDLELRVLVSIERRFEPGMQRSAWTRSIGGRSRELPADGDPASPRDLSNWTTIARDERLERELLARVATRLGRAAAAEASR